MSETKNIRILHFLSVFHTGGIENWLLELMHEMYKLNIVFDFLIYGDEDTIHKEEIKRYGGNVFFISRKHNLIKFSKMFKHIISENKYHAIHSHTHFYSGIILYLAKKSNVPLRIAHSHTDIRFKRKKESFLKNQYYNLMRFLILRNSNLGIATSKAAAKSLYGPNWEKDKRWHIIPSGLNFNKYFTEENRDKASIREEYNIPENMPIVVHLSNFSDAKNHLFTLKVFKEFLKFNPDSKLLLIGDGINKASIINKINELNINSNVILTGIRKDIVHILNSVDIAILPSLWEGLSLTALELQASGIPTVLSDTIPKDVFLIPELIKSFSLDEGVQKWAEQLNELYITHRSINTNERKKRILESNFNITNSVKLVEQLYRSKL